MLKEKGKINLKQSEIRNFQDIMKKYGKRIRHFTKYCRQKKKQEPAGSLHNYF